MFEDIRSFLNSINTSSDSNLYNDRVAGKFANKKYRYSHVRDVSYTRM